MLMGIPSEKLPPLWNICAPLIDKAIQTTECYFDIDDVYQDALTRDCQIWAWIENREIVACFVTRILFHKNKPDKKVCSVPLIGGKGLRIWRHGVDETLGEWAKAQGCEYLEGYARPGWLRVLKNWFTISTTIRRKL